MRGEKEGLKNRMVSFMVQHELSGLRPETTKSDMLRELKRWLPVTSVMLNALCVD